MVVPKSRGNGEVQMVDLYRFAGQRYKAELERLWRAVDADAAGLVANLLGPDRDLFPASSRLAQPLWPVTRRAASRGATAVLALLMGQLGCDPNWVERSVGGSTAIHWAAASGDVAAIRVLVRASADPTRFDGRQVTPLHVAAACGYTHAAKALLLAGAAVATRSATGWGPLDSAAWGGHLLTVQLLVRNDADTARPCADPDPSRGGRTPAQLAADRGHRDVAQWLQEWNPRELYWSRWTHRWCLPWSASSVTCMFRAAVRLAGGGHLPNKPGSVAGASTSTAAGDWHNGCPGAAPELWLPIELWHRVLSFCKRNELGRPTS